MAFHPPNSLFQYQHMINPGTTAFGATVPFGSVFGTSNSASPSFGTSSPYTTFGGVSTSAGSTFGTSAPFSSFNGASTFGNNAYSCGFSAGSGPVFGTSVPFGVTSTSGPTFGTSGAFCFGGPSTYVGPSFGISAPFSFSGGASTSAGIFGTSAPFCSFNGASGSVGQTTWGSSPFGTSTTVASNPSTTKFFNPTPFGVAATSGPTFGTTSTFSFAGPSTSASPTFGTSSAFNFGGRSTTVASNPSTTIFFNPTPFGVAATSGPTFGTASTFSFAGPSTSASPTFGTSSAFNFGGRSTLANPSFGNLAPFNSFTGASSSVGQTAWGTCSPFGTSTTFASKPSTSWSQPSFLDAQRLQSGTSSVFGKNTRGSKVASYTSTREVDNTKIMSISAMQVYKDKSHEELRFEDFELLKEPANSPFSTPYPNNFFNTFKTSSFGPVNPFPTSTFPPKQPFFNPTNSIFRPPVPDPSVNNPTATNTFIFKPQQSIFETPVLPATPVNPFSSTINPSTSQPPSFPFSDSNIFKPPVSATPVNPFSFTMNPSTPQPPPFPFPDSNIFKPSTISTFPSPPVNPLFPTTSSTFPTQPSPCIQPNISIFNPPGPVNSFYTPSNIFPSQPSPSVLPVPPVNQKPNGQQCIQPVVMVNPFASKPATEVPVNQPNQVTRIQYGISSMPAVSKSPSPIAKTTIWKSVRHMSLRHTSSPAHRRNSKTSENKVTFTFGKNEEGLCRSSPFQPRQNPRSWVMSAQTEDSPVEVKSQYQNDVEISAMMPKLPEGEEYHIEPSIEELKANERAEPGFCSRVKNFVVGRKDKGSIKFLGETDVRNLDIGPSVIFNDREVIVNSGDPVGIGFNKPAEVTMLNVKCVTKDKKSVTDGPQLERYKKMLVDKAVENGAEFVSYDPVRGEWKFRVQHFSA